MRRGLLVLLLVLASGCEEEGATLVVQLRTDLVPGAEFTGVVVQTDTTGPVDAIARRDMDFISGVRVAEISGLPTSSNVRVDVQLVTSLGVVVERPVLVDLSAGSVAVTVRVFRSCLLVTCPDGSDGRPLACFDGQCVQPTCTQETPGACGMTDGCTGDADCPSLAMCATSICDDGNCYYDEIEGACGVGLFCAAETGCETLPEFPDAGPRPMDAGVDVDAGPGDLDAGPGPVDAGQDAAMPDAGTRDCTLPMLPLLDFMGCGAATPRQSLIEGVIVAERDGCFVEGQLLGAPEVISFVPLTNRSGDGYLELMGDGRFRFIGAGNEIVIDIGIRVNTTFGVSEECVRAFVIDPAMRTKRMIGTDGSLASSWDPTGVPTMTDSVWVPIGSRTMPAITVGELMIETGAELTVAGTVTANLLFGTMAGNARFMGGGVMAANILGDLTTMDGGFVTEGSLHVSGNYSTGGSPAVMLMSPLFRISVDGSFDTTGSDFGWDLPFPGSVLAIGGAVTIPRMVMPPMPGNLVLGGSSISIGMMMPMPFMPATTIFIENPGAVSISAPEMGAMAMDTPGGTVTFTLPTNFAGPVSMDRPVDFSATPVICDPINLGPLWSTTTPGRYGACRNCTDSGAGQCASVGL